MSLTSPLLFNPIRFRGVELSNRIMISPMCTYQANTDGKALDMHFAHYAQFSLGGAGLIMLEATAVQERGRITAWDLGLWDDQQVAPLQRLVDFAHQQNSKMGVQLGHAGLRASSKRPWNGGKYLDADDKANGGIPWAVVGPSPELFSVDENIATALSVDDINGIVKDWGKAALRANEAGFDVLEIHGAHGFLISEFLSPLSNLRTDEYGGDYKGRVRLALEVTKEVRKNWPKQKPLFFRLSVVDGIDVGWSIEDSVTLAMELKDLGVDVIDCTSGGFNIEREKVLTQVPSFQVYLSEAVKEKGNISTATVGLITHAEQAESILQSEKADLIAIGRTALNNPYWPRHAAHHFEVDKRFEKWPEQYGWWLFRWATSLKKVKNAWSLSNPSVN